MKFSPRLDARLVHFVTSADVDRLSVADVWRATGDAAESLGCCRPGYHSVLRLVLAERERRAERHQAIVDAVDEFWSYTGTDYEALARRLHRTSR